MRAQEFGAAGWIAFVAAIALTFSAGACGGDAEPGEAPSAADATSPTSPWLPQTQVDTGERVLDASSVERATPAAEALEIGYRVGDRAPAFSLSLAEGRIVSSTDLAAEGRPLFLFFHSTY